MYGDQTRIDAAKCMSHAYGGEWVYDHSAKAMIKKDNDYICKFIITNYS